MTDDLFETVKAQLTWSDIAPIDDNRTSYVFCEIHGDTDTADLRIYEDGNWKCHACGAAGQDLIRYVAERDNISDYEAVQQLIRDHGLDIEMDESEESREQRRRLQRIRRIQEQVVEAAHNNLSTADRQRLKEHRDWTDEIIDDLRIGWMDDDLFNTLKERHGDDLEQAGVHYGMTGEDGSYVIPHLKRNGQPYLITTRDPNKSSDNPAKYMQSKNTDYVENDIYILQERRSDILIITEGYPDAISAYMAGYDVAAAGCGSFEGEHDRIAGLAASYDGALLVTDNDGTGQQNLRETAISIAANTTVYIHEWSDDTPEKYDLDDWTSDNDYDIARLIEEATDYINYLIEKCESHDRTERARAKNHLFRILSEWSRAEQDEVLRDIPGDFRSNREALEDYLNEDADGDTGLATSIDWGELESLYLNDDVNKIRANNETARAILRRYEFRTLCDTEEIWMFNDPVYEPGGEQFVRQLLQNKLGEFMRKKDTNEILEKIRTQTFIDRPKPQKYSHLIAVENGVYNVEKGELEPGNPDYFLVNQCPVRYDEDAECPAIKEFLSDIVREEDLTALQEMMGYALLADQPFEKAWMLLGSGENGKSTFLNLLTQLIGEENVVSPSLHRLMNNKYARATLYGKLANINADLSEQALQRTGVFKQLTGGDQIQAEEKYKPSFEFWNTATLIYAANKLPKTTDTTDAFFRRWIIIEFPYKFTDADDDHKDKDPNIADQLYQDEELSGLLNFALEGLHRVLDQEGFSDTRHMEEIKEEWLRRTNPLMAFTENYTTSDPDCVVPKAEFADAVREFCRDKGAQFPTNEQIGQDLPGMVDAVTTVRPQINNDRPNCWEGIRVTKEYANQIDQYRKDGAGYRLIEHDGEVENADDEDDDSDYSGGDDSRSSGSNGSSGDTADSRDGNNENQEGYTKSSESSNENVNPVKGKSNSNAGARTHARGKSQSGVEETPDSPDISDTTGREQLLSLSNNTLKQVIDDLTTGTDREFVAIDDIASYFDAPRDVIEMTIDRMASRGELYNPTGDGYRLSSE